MEANKIRNIAIIAHVDHGKTTLVDQLLQQGGAYRENQVFEERAMDSMDLEKEKGITIKAKNTSVTWHGNIINIVDTPGHADFGAEVERVMKMVDGVLLLVDAYEGPQAQTRFVLKKALNQGLQPIVVINKVDRDHSDPSAAKEKVLELFLDLDANEAQFNAPFLYASAKNGWAVGSLDDQKKDMDILFKSIMQTIPAPAVEDDDFRMLISNIDWDDFVGRIAIGRVLSGSVKIGETLNLIQKSGDIIPVKTTKVFQYTGLNTQESDSAVAGNIIGLAGLKEVDIGETIVKRTDQSALPFVEIDPPTIQMEFCVNDGPLGGRDGKLVTSRQIRERLLREKKSNISINVEDTENGSRFLVSARGAMQIAVLVETMRREGFEVLVSRPTVIYRIKDGVKEEPFETLWIETPNDAVGGIMENLSNRKGQMTNMEPHSSGNSTLIEAKIPTRGLIGFESDLVNMTSGHGVMSHLFDAYGPIAGEIKTRNTGTLVSMDQGQARPYALNLLQERGRLMVSANEEVYEGMIVGECPRKQDLPVNPTKEKQLTNVRASGSDKNVQLAPPLSFSIERAIEYIATDAYVEATPNFLRMRKKVLNFDTRRKLEKKVK